MVLAYRVDPGLFQSADAFTEYVGRYREAGIDELVFYWPVDAGTFERSPAYEAALHQIVADFAAREQHLSGVAIADTALVLERLAAGRGMAVEPAGGGILRPDLGL